MAKFCTKCGKELKEGKQCNCKNNLKNKTEDTIKFDFIETIKNIIKKPVDTVKEMTVTTNTNTAIIWMLITTIIFSFIAVILTRNNPLLIIKRISCIEVFFLMSFLSILTHLIIASSTYLVLKINNKQIKWEETFIAVTTILLPITAVSMINIIMLFISIPISLLLFEIGILISILIFYEKVKEWIGDSNKSIYITVSILILSMIFFTILMSVIL